MDITIFAKMRTKPGMTARVFNAPEGYPESPALDFTQTQSAAFVHLFAESRAQLEASFQEAADVAVAASDTLFWVSYPKSTGKRRYDINRDSLWDLVLPKGWHPVAQVSLDETWSAVRLRPNEPGKEYARPNAARGKADE